MNAGPYFKFTEAISLSIGCKDQAEVGHHWEKLTED
jgi:predicted 3-demethylubiquinone-9 3-methyltransferase (glyoxalase superfamily)